MSEIEGNFEKELPVPEHNLSTKMSPESKQILNSIFKEDFEGAEVDTINDISLDIDPELEMKLLFADDYSEKSEVANDDDICNEMGQGTSIDISEQYKPNSKFGADGKTYETDDNVNIVYEKLIENDFEPGESKEDLDKINNYSEKSLNEMLINNLEDVSPETADAMFNALVEGEKNDPSDITEHGFADIKELVKSEMGWSDDITNSIENMDQYEVYKNASLNEKEIDGRPCLVKEINWDYVDPKTGFTNRELAAKGRTPIDVNTGEKIELHHMGQEYSAPFAELCENSEHGDGKHRILHPKMENSWRNNPELDKKYSNVDKPNHWRERSQEV